MKNKMLLASLVVSAGLAASTTTASAFCGQTAGVGDLQNLNGFSTIQAITFSNGSVWKCETIVNRDKVKYFTKGTVASYAINASEFDNCLVYKTVNGGARWTYWFDPPEGSIDTRVRSQVGTNTNGIRLGC